MLTRADAKHIVIEAWIEIYGTNSAIDDAREIHMDDLLEFIEEAINKRLEQQRHTNIKIILPCTVGELVDQICQPTQG